MGHTRVGIVEDHVLLSQSVAIALRAEGLVVVAADTAGEPELLRSLEPDASMLVLLDLDLDEPLVDGGRLIRPLRDRKASVLVVTGSHDRMRIAAAVEAGALGWVGKDQPFSDLLAAIMRAAAGDPVLGDGEREELLAQLRRHRTAERRRLEPFESLTSREQQVLEELAAGKSVERIATDWFVSEATVRSQVRAVLTKLGVRSQLAAVAKAREAGWSAGG